MSETNQDLMQDCICLIFVHVFLGFYSLGPLVGKVKEYHIESIVDNLCSNMLSTNEQLRDISSIGDYYYIANYNSILFNIN